MHFCAYYIQKHLKKIKKYSLKKDYRWYKIRIRNCRKIICEGRFAVKKRLLVAMLSVSLLTMALTGCGNADAGNQTDTEPADVEVQQDDGDGQLESGKVSLRVWVERRISRICRR